MLTTFAIPYDLVFQLTGRIRKLAENVQDKFHEAIVNLSRRKVESNKRVGSQEHAPVSNYEILAVEQSVFKDTFVQAELKKLGLPKATKFICDPWIYGLAHRMSIRAMIVIVTDRL